MNSINFNTGFKEYAINGDKTKTIKFNPADFAILDRINKSISKIDEISEKFKEIKKDAEQVKVKSDKTDIDLSALSAASDKLTEFDAAIREQINYIFDSDVCTNAFGNTNCTSFVDGEPLYIGFLNAFIPVLQKDIAEEKAKSSEKMKKYTDQVKLVK